MKLYIFISRDESFIFSTKAKLEAWLTRDYAYSAYGAGRLFSEAHRAYEAAPGSRHVVCSEGACEMLGIREPFSFLLDERIYELDMTKHRMEVADA